MAVQLDDVIGKRVVVDEAGIDAAGRRLVEVLCECGSMDVVRASSIHPSCRRCSRRVGRPWTQPQPEVGMRIGDREIVDVLPPGCYSVPRVRLLCVCGEHQVVNVVNKLWRTTVCNGCAQRRRRAA